MMQTLAICLVNDYKSGVRVPQIHAVEDHEAIRTRQVVDFEDDFLIKRLNCDRKVLRLHSCRRLVVFIYRATECSPHK